MDGQNSVDTNNGYYDIFINMGGYEETALDGYNGQNYEISKITIKASDSDEGELNIEQTNRQKINEFFSLIGKDKATLVSKKDLTQTQKDRLTNNTALTIQSERFEVSNADSTVMQPNNEKNYTINVYFERRPNFELKVTKNIVAARMILADGQVLKSYKREDKNGVIGEGTAAMVKWEVDNELKHGATIQIEYDITVENKGELDCTGYTLIDYLDYNNGNLQYRSESKMITEDKNNSDYKWEIVNVSDIQDKTQPNLIDGKTYLKIEEGKEGNFTLKGTKNGSNEADKKNTYKLLASIVITSTEANMYNYQNSAEIIEYKNSEGRVDIKSIPGNYNPVDKNILESDSGVAEELCVIPPTGIKPKWYTSILETILNIIL